MGRMGRNMEIPALLRVKMSKLSVKENVLALNVSIKRPAHTHIELFFKEDRLQ